MSTLEQLLNVEWNGSRSMVKHCLQHSIYVQLGDRFVDLGDRKPSIDKTMWYDDETDGPDENFKNFKEYNMRLHAPRRIEDRTSRNFGVMVKAYIKPQYCGDKTHGKLACLVFEDVDSPRATGHEVTTEDLKLFNKALDEAKADYEKRLAMYWKRYSKHIHASGYWVNR